MFALVVLRRKDFGRRRALGAKRSLIVNLLLLQVGFLGIGGALLGVAAGLVGLTVSGALLSGGSFSAAVAVRAVLSAELAALPPAIFASRRDPLHELRVP